jgi:YkoP domain
MARGREAVAPAFLDPVLGLVERIDRTLRRVWPVGPDAVLALERHRHHGPPLTLADGVPVRRGDRAWIVHFDNGRLRRLVRGESQTEAWRAARRDLGRIAALHLSLPEGERPVAYHGTTLLAALAHRAGFELHPRRRTPGVRLEDWYLRSVLARWALGGRERLQRGRHPLRTQEAWLSGAELVRRYGAPPPRSSPIQPQA